MAVHAERPQIVAPETPRVLLDPGEGVRPSVPQLNVVVALPRVGMQKLVAPITGVVLPVGHQPSVLARVLALVRLLDFDGPQQAADPRQLLGGRGAVVPVEQLVHVPHLEPDHSLHVLSRVRVERHLVQQHVEPERVVFAGHGSHQIVPVEVGFAVVIRHAQRHGSCTHRTTAPWL